MNEYKLCVALGQLPEDMIAAAMDEGADSRRRRKFQALTVLRRVTSGVVAAAIVLAMFFGLFVPGGDQIVTAPGVLVVTAYDDGLDPEGVVLEEGIVLPQWAMYPFFSGMPSMFILGFQVPERYGDDVEFLIYTEQSGMIYGFGESFRSPLWEYIEGWSETPEQSEDYYVGTVPNGGTILWLPYSHSHYASADVLEDRHMCIVIKAGGNIIGYAVLRAQTLGGEPYDSLPCDLYTTVLVESVLYPQVDGRYQMVTEMYVFEQMQQAVAGK